MHGGGALFHHRPDLVKLPERCVTALRALWDQQLTTRAAAGDAWENNDLVFATRTGRKLSAGNVRREFRRVITKAGLVGTDWTPRELRHSFVSLLSDSGMPVEQISRLVGHRGTAVTETAYRLQIRPQRPKRAGSDDRNRPLSWVGDTGFEPVTSPV
ncbi:MAG TPA: tyrosine-type recombinase/integrase [Streptosporangiaceae bacterium]|nr:tyrosine-type recombinase/integrase [Streptosporangiaceae bacterium]